VGAGDDGRLNVRRGAKTMDLTKRRMFCVLKTYHPNGAAADRHRAVISACTLSFQIKSVYERSGWIEFIISRFQRPAIQVAGNGRHPRRFTSTPARRIGIRP